jgi:Asp-tRNA(Asn)/Glu-tRNA(Gln) amidotransferase A subunit family amidase
MTRTLSTLTTIAKAVVDAQPWRIDPRCHQLPWRQELYDEVQTRPLVVGLLVDDGVVKIHPPLKRALLQLNTRLKAAGHEVIPWNVEGHAEVVDVLVCTLTRFFALVLTNLGFLLYCRRWARCPRRSYGRRRALYPTRRSAHQPRQGHFCL